MSSPDTAAAHISHDKPIEHLAEDELGRQRLAETIARQALKPPGSEGLVVGVTGEWGSGKSSVLNMVEEAGASVDPEAVFIRFNSWMFSGSQDLVQRFFVELGAQLKKDGRFKQISSRLNEYGERLIPFVDAILKTKATDALTQWRTSRERSVEERRAELRALLEPLEHRIVVLIDDVDRLDQHEIREVMRLVKLVGDFPKITYILAFDRRKTEAACGDETMSGRDYLEKILQVVHPLPPVPPSTLQRLLLGEIGKAVHKDIDPVSVEDWSAIFLQVILPMIDSPRDIKRYINAAPAALALVGDEVAVVDVLALTAIAVFETDVHDLLGVTRTALTNDRETDELLLDKDKRREQHREAIQRFVGAATPEHRPSVESFCRRIFPHSAQHLGGLNSDDGPLFEWRRDRRVAWPEVLDAYLHKTVGADVVTTGLTRQAVEALGDEERFAALCAPLSPTQLEDLIQRVDDYVDEIAPERAADAALTLLNRLEALRTEKTHMFDFGPEPSLGRPIVRLLRRVDQADRDVAAINLFSRSSTLTQRFELLRWYANDEWGEPLVSDAVREDLEKDFYVAAMRTPATELLAERGPGESWALSTASQTAMARRG